MKKILIALVILTASIQSFAQNADVESVKSVLQKYREATEKLDVPGTEKLFTSDSKIFESGGSEGTYAHYLEHHLGPEFREFKSFKFNNYKAEIVVDGNYAFATETYNYVIVLAKDNTEVKRKGVATSVLKKVDNGWKIMISHNSSRK
ncbi:MAG: nuclear transport factor 2 family protein [Daejeonella sp.]